MSDTNAVAIPENAIVMSNCRRPPERTKTSQSNHKSKIVTSLQNSNAVAGGSRVRGCQMSERPATESAPFHTSSPADQIWLANTGGIGTSWIAV